MDDNHGQLALWELDINIPQFKAWFLRGAQRMDTRGTLVDPYRDAAGTVWRQQRRAG